MRAAISVLSVSLSLFLSLVVAAAADVPAKKTFQAGAYAINVSPLKFPVIINGGMTERTFSIKAGGKSLSLSTYFMPDGKLAQYLITPAQ